jgi:hypothetical protein
LGLVTLGCEGSLKLLGSTPVLEEQPNEIDGTGTGQPDDPNLPVDPNLPEDAPRELPSPSSRVSRLSHNEFEHTARDLLGAQQSLGITTTFVADSSSTTFNNNGGNLVVTSAEWQDYQTAAEELARQATLTTQSLTAIAGGTLPADDEELIRALGRRAFRRALTTAEVAAYVAVAPEAATYYPAMPARQAVARLVLEAMLQSPNFLYRVELSTDVTSGVIPLSGVELASRLSYALWQSMPDEALLRAGEAGELQTVDGFTAEASRLLADPKAREAVAAFHNQLLGTSRYADLTRSVTLFPEFSVGLRDSMRQEQERFVQAQIFTEQAGLEGLFTSPTSYVDANLARVYGLTGNFDSSFQKITFTDGKRAGLFTQVGFLATNATSTETDPIHRGVFLNHKLLCAPLPAPPNVVPMLPRADPTVPKTMRTRITEFTGAGTCGAGCHSTMINPAGFAYEHYDALGRWRDLDNGLPVNAADSYTFEGRPRAFDGAANFGAVMTEEPMAHRCYAQHWVEFLHGRGLGEADRAMINRVGKQSWKEKTPVTQVLRLLVESESFKTRAVEER